MSNEDKTPEKILLSMKIVSGRIKTRDLTDEQYKLLSCENMKPINQDDLNSIADDIILTAFNAVLGS
jgi:hypothetical protein